ncbi:AMP-binding protein [Camelimonas fluminis]|uniref:AMP-binding protein n=1 Tax=Camelimonas fluminis TaxID=1576911 RepID=UPI003571281D
MDPASDVVKLIYTSGTSGKSKGAMEAHRNAVHNTITHTHLIPFDLPVNYTFLPMVFFIIRIASRI